MEYVAIEKNEYELMVDTIKNAVKEINNLVEERSVESEWVENGELSEMLGLTKRQMQGYRERGVLGYSIIGRKIYYKRAEVEKLIKQNTIKCKK